MDAIKFNTVDDYINFMPPEYIEMLQELRETILQAIPEAIETISYNMPAYKFRRVLVYFALAKKHVGLYPTASGVEAFKDELKNYNHAKGSIQFPLDKPLPLKLIADIARFRLEEEKIR